MIRHNGGRGGGKGSGLTLRLLAAASLALPLAWSAVAEAQQVEFRHPLDDEPLEIGLPEGDKRTEAVEQFHQTGENAYVGDEEAIAEGKKLYQRFCQSCHLPDATGRMGPSLVDETIRYPRNETDVGLFETIHAGAAGAMQAFGNRMSQDEILRVIAFLRSLQQS